MKPVAVATVSTFAPTVDYEANCIISALLRPLLLLQHVANDVALTAAALSLSLSSEIILLTLV